MTRPRILIAGIGNIFLGDDAFGVEVVRRLLAQPLPPGVRAVDFGIRGFDLATAIMDGPGTVILVDAVRRGGPPGTLYLIEPDVGDPVSAELAATIEPHSLNPSRVLQYVRMMGGRLPVFRLLGCEPASFGTADEPQTELSPAVAKAVNQALSCIHVLLAAIPDCECSPDSPLG